MQCQFAEAFTKALGATLCRPVLVDPIRRLKEMSGFARSAMKDHLVAVAIGVVAGAALGALMHSIILGVCIGVGVCVTWERRNRRNSI
jgi:hypothetical protein